MEFVTSIDENHKVTIMAATFAPHASTNIDNEYRMT